LKSLFFADLHFHPHEVMATVINGRNSRLQDCIDFMSTITLFAEQNGIKRLFCLGDFFHTRTKIDVEIYTLAYDILSGLFDKGFEIYLIAGNHDLYYKFSSKITSLKPLSRYAHIITQPTILHDANTTFVLIPYYERPDDFKKAIDSLDYTKIVNPVFLTHAEYRGSLKASTSKIPTKHGIDSSYFPQNAKHILMGHYHMPQNLPNNAKYLGSPLQISLREIFEEKYFYVFDSETLQLNPIIANTPRFAIVEYPSEKVLKYCKKDGSIEEAITNNYVEVVAYESIKKNSKFHKLLQTARNIIVTTKLDKKSKGTQGDIDIDLTSIDIDSLSELFAEEHHHENLSKEFLLSVRDQITKI
jgi:DNA repair exonuclease SbcCD nuclease subunit